MCLFVWVCLTDLLHTSIQNWVLFPLYLALNHLRIFDPRHAKWTANLLINLYNLCWPQKVLLTGGIFFLCGNTKWCVKIKITVHKMIVTRTCSFNSVLSWRCETLWDGEALGTFQMALRNRREVAVQSLGINSRWLWSAIGSDGSEEANSDCKAAPLWPWGFAYERKQTIRRVWSVSPLLLAE